MEDLKIKLDEVNSLQFQLDIANNGNESNKASDVRFVINNNDYNLSFNATKVDENQYKVDIPMLGNLMRSGTKKCFVEVIVEDKHFKPWESLVEFEDVLKVEAKFVNKTKNEKTNNSPIQLTMLKNESKKVDEEVITEKEDEIFEQKEQELDLSDIVRQSIKDALKQRK